MKPKTLSSRSLLALCLSAPSFACAPAPAGLAMRAPHVSAALVEPSRPAQLDPSQPLSHEELTCAVLAVNPSIAAWHERWAAAEQGPSQVTSLGDTKLSYAFAPGTIGSTQVSYGQIITVQQSFELGQSELERSVLRLEADALGYGIEQRRNELAHISASLAAEHFAIERALETNLEHQALAKEAFEIGTAHYASGHGTQQDPILADLELAHVEHERIVLESQRRIVRAQINGLLHRAPSTPLPEAPKELPDGLERPPDDDLDSQAQRPERGAASARLAASEATIELAKRRRNPSLSASASYNSMWQNASHRLMLGVGVSVPLQVSSIRAGVTRSQHEKRAAAHELAALDDQIAVQIAIANERLQEAHHITSLHNTRLIPGAKNRLRATRVAYENGEGTFSDLIEAERELRGLELHLHRANADLMHRRADLAFALGERMDCSAPKTDSDPRSADVQEVDHD